MLRAQKQIATTRVLGKHLFLQKIFFPLFYLYFSSLFMSLGEAFLSSGICRCFENQYQMFKCETKSEIKYQQSDSTHPVYTGPYSNP